MNDQTVLPFNVQLPIDMPHVSENPTLPCMISKYGVTGYGCHPWHFIAEQVKKQELSYFVGDLDTMNVYKELKFTTNDCPELSFYDTHQRIMSLSSKQLQVYSIDKQQQQLILDYQVTAEFLTQQVKSKYAPDYVISCAEYEDELDMIGILCNGCIYFVDNISGAIVRKFALSSFAEEHQHSLCIWRNHVLHLIDEHSKKQLHVYELQ